MSKSTIRRYKYSLWKTTRKTKASGRNKHRAVELGDLRNDVNSSVVLPIFNSMLHESSVNNTDTTTLAFGPSMNDEFYGMCDPTASPIMRVDHIQPGVSKTGSDDAGSTYAHLQIPVDTFLNRGILPTTVNFITFKDVNVTDPKGEIVTVFTNSYYYYDYYTIA